ncbi:hypothetical protein BC939DRAFT_97359 [Gamsiella multidivaricata]|uniref:uncharacterized protein n=1 Tax=Gamsiella multidivaricata TaxID=101098 RepID=UPI00221F01DE|nr:uncharacterized protein BC939DRAFT_97359 [Gamsiella multidivaricata]KAI7832190.1 hypothetical protein BC939DRAFT_97359 [Gamsiella multidivaricata]
MRGVSYGSYCENGFNRPDIGGSRGERTSEQRNCCREWKALRIESVGVRSMDLRKVGGNRRERESNQAGLKKESEAKGDSKYETKMHFYMCIKHATGEGRHVYIQQTCDAEDRKGSRSVSGVMALGGILWMNCSKSFVASSFQSKAPILLRLWRPFLQ